MDLRFDLLHIFLVILNFIDDGEASSDDESGKSVEGEKHKWSADEEFKLIFFDVLTDTGAGGHFSRIKSEWRREFPDSNLTDAAIYNKLVKLRKGSMDQGELKRNFKWNEELERELIDVYLTTYPYMRDATISIEEEWKRRYPDFQARAKSLMRRIQTIFKRYRNSKYKKPGMSLGPSHVVDLEKVREIRHHWTEDEVATLLHIHNLTDTGEPNHSERIELMWRVKYPKSNVSIYGLLSKLHKLQKALGKKGGREKYFKWTPEEEKMLVDTYLNTYPYRKDVSTTFKEVWKHRIQGSQATERYLQRRARNLIRENKYPEYSEQVLFKKNLQSEDREDVEHTLTPKLKSARRRGVQSEDLRGGSQAESSRIRSRKRNEYIPKMRLLEEILRGQKKVGPEKRHGKAPMVYASDESSSSSPAVMSEDSE